MIKIRQADIRDLEVLALLGRITWAETFGSLFTRWEDVQNYVDENFSIESIKSFIENPKVYFWIAYFNNLPIGYAKIEMDVVTNNINGKKVCQLRNIYVLNDFHSKKVGSLLWSSMLVKVLELNCDTMWLSVLHSNTKAINFYLKNNFYNKGAFDLKIGAESFIMNIMIREFNNS